LKRSEAAGRNLFRFAPEDLRKIDRGDALRLLQI
jgi:hypothetical protein